MAVHRIIETFAARSGDSTAISDDQVTLSYRELNQRANAVARHLIAHGFRRGGMATVRLPRCADTAIALLGILKAGGAYVLIGSALNDAKWPRGVSFAEKVDGDEVRYRAVDITAALRERTVSSANLPILARDSDVACMIPGRDGSPLLLVPHATIMSLRERTVAPVAEWSGEDGPLDLWIGLMNGATVTLSGSELRSAA